MSESTLPPDRDDFCEVPCDPCEPRDTLSVEQRRVLSEHDRLTKALGTTGSAQPVKSVAPAQPQDWGGFFSEANDQYARLHKYLLRHLVPPAKAN